MAFQQEQGFSTDTFFCGQKNLGVRTRVSGCGTSVHTCLPALLSMLRLTFLVTINEITPPLSMIFRLSSSFPLNGSDESSSRVIWHSENTAILQLVSLASKLHSMHSSHASP